MTNTALLEGGKRRNYLVIQPDLFLGTPGRLRAGAPLQPASWPHRLSSLLSKLFPFIRAAAVGRSRPAESSATSLFDRLGVMSSTGISQVSSAASHPSPRSGAFRKNGLLLKRAMERFSLELEATEVFYGKNQSCRACRVEHACTFVSRVSRRYHLVSPRPM